MEKTEVANSHFENMYTPVKVLPVKTKQIFPTETEGVLVPLAIKNEPVSGQDRYIQISPDHKRSLADLSVSKTAWQDEFGNYFDARRYKGNFIPDFSNIKFVDPSQTDPDIYVIGTENKGYFDQINKASHFLRKNGLPTERAIGCYEINEVPYRGEIIPIEQAKQKFIDENKGLNPKQKEYLEKTTFVITESDLPIHERFSDLNHVASNEEFKVIMGNVFKYVNSATENGTKSLFPGSQADNKIFDINKPEDIKRFFVEYIPKNAGIWLGRFQKLGLSHGFLHSQNWLLTGFAIDLDSVKGEALGDIKSQEKDYKHDASLTLFSLADLTSIIQKGSQKFGFNITGEEAENMKVIFATNLIKERFLNRRGITNIGFFKNRILKYARENIFTKPLTRNDIRDSVWENVVSSIMKK